MTSTPSPLERAEAGLPAFVSMSGPQKIEKGLEIQVAALLSVARSLELLARSRAAFGDEPAGQVLDVATGVQSTGILPLSATLDPKHAEILDAIPPKAAAPKRPTLKEKLAAELAAKAEADVVADPIAKAEDGAYGPLTTAAFLDSPKGKKAKKGKGKKKDKAEAPADSTPAPAAFLEDLDVDLDDDDDEDPLGDNSGEGGRSFEV